MPFHQLKIYTYLFARYLSEFISVLLYQFSRSFIKSWIARMETPVSGQRWMEGYC